LHFLVGMEAQALGSDSTLDLMPIQFYKDPRLPFWYAHLFLDNLWTSVSKEKPVPHPPKTMQLPAWQIHKFPIWCILATGNVYNHLPEEMLFQHNSYCRSNSELLIRIGGVQILVEFSRNNIFEMGIAIYFMMQLKGWLRAYTLIGIQ
jgi:hypothetical protein